MEADEAEASLALYMAGVHADLGTTPGWPAHVPGLCSHMSAEWAASPPTASAAELLPALEAALEALPDWDAVLQRTATYAQRLAARRSDGWVSAVAEYFK